MKNQIYDQIEEALIQYSKLHGNDRFSFILTFISNHMDEFTSWDKRYLLSYLTLDFHRGIWVWENMPACLIIVTIMDDWEEEWLSAQPEVQSLYMGSNSYLKSVFQLIKD